MEKLGERPVWSMSGGEMLSTLDRLDVVLARLETFRLQVIAGLDGIGHAREIGAHDTSQLLEFRYRLDRNRARRDVRLARTLEKYHAVSAALPVTDRPAELGGEPAGEVFLRPAQAEAIVSALEQVPTTVPVEDLAVAEQELVGLARHLSPIELRRAGRRVRNVLDTDGPEPEERKAYDREALTLTNADRGVKFRGYLANENAELLRALIHAGARPHKTIDGAPDPRPREKRQADALTTALTTAATTWDVGGVGAARTPGTTVNAGETAMEDRASEASLSVPAEANSAPAGRRTSGHVPGFGAKANITVTIDLEGLRSAAADAMGDTVYGDGLSAAAIRRLACDAKIIPLVLGSNSEPLDVGRSERLVTRAMRRALNTRDRGCVVCGAPPIQCDAHHLVSWIDGGETKISNLALLCRRHHIDLHDGDWTITIACGKVHVARPSWADPPPQPRADPPPQPWVDPPRQPRADPPAQTWADPPRQPRADPPPRPSIAPDAPLTPGEAATLAIWGELPARPQPAGENAPVSDPWGESDTTKPQPTQGSGSAGSVRR
ncbi:DUF222 domain-containing protein [Kribbella sp. NBC_00709]|uniref:HNH endonuclease signature motif containing protein n=1 Tax=Kribbella sp. NBC_00709 TaxID=2975972 RepID=UPI002E2DBB7A|nr:DUF222 domain-containing protein [Kribbella sp. NBC_00709]